VAGEEGCGVNGRYLARAQLLEVFARVVPHDTDVTWWLDNVAKCVDTIIDAAKEELRAEMDVLSPSEKGDANGGVTE
jgi:hypothetical protein